MKTKKMSDDVVWLNTMMLREKTTVEICIISRAPYLWTRCPTVKSAKALPMAPKLMSEPNSPLDRPRCAFTSGNLGTQLIIERPKRKKITLRPLSSFSWVSIRKARWLTLCGLRLGVGLMDQPRQTN